jgi:hypothetical protein
MLFKSVKRSGWEYIDFIVHNGSASYKLPGEPVCWDIVTAKDGSVTVPATAVLNAFAGIVCADTIGTSGQPNDTGRVRAYGYANNIRITSATTINPSQMLKISNGTSSVIEARTFAHAVSTAEAAYVEVLESVVVAATTHNGSTVTATDFCGFIRGLK